MFGRDACESLFGRKAIVDSLVKSNDKVARGCIASTEQVVEIGRAGLLQDSMGLGELRWVLGINLLLQLVYLPTGIALATRAKALVKGFGWGVLASAILLGAIDAVFYQRLLN